MASRFDGGSTEALFEEVSRLLKEKYSDLTRCDNYKAQPGTFDGGNSVHGKLFLTRMKAHAYRIAEGLGKVAA